MARLPTISARQATLSALVVVTALALQTGYNSTQGQVSGFSWLNEIWSRVTGANTYTPPTVTSPSIGDGGQDGEVPLDTGTPDGGSADAGAGMQVPPFNAGSDPTADQSISNPDMRGAPALDGAPSSPDVSAGSNANTGFAPIGGIPGLEPAAGTDQGPDGSMGGRVTIPGGEMPSLTMPSDGGTPSYPGTDQPPTMGTPDLGQGAAPSADDMGAQDGLVEPAPSKPDASVFDWLSGILQRFSAPPATPEAPDGQPDLSNDSGMMPTLPGTPETPGGGTPDASGGRGENGGGSMRVTWNGSGEIPCPSGTTPYTLNGDGSFSFNENGEMEVDCRSGQQGAAGNGGGATDDGMNNYPPAMPATNGGSGGGGAAAGGDGGIGGILLMLGF
jgi:hypothetical protein